MIMDFQRRFGLRIDTPIQHLIGQDVQLLRRTEVSKADIQVVSPVVV